MVQPTPNRCWGTKQPSLHQAQGGSINRSPGWYSVGFTGLTADQMAARVSWAQGDAVMGLSLQSTTDPLSDALRIARSVRVVTGRDYAKRVPGDSQHAYEFAQPNVRSDYGLREDVAWSLDVTLSFAAGRSGVPSACLRIRQTPRGPGTVVCKPHANGTDPRSDLTWIERTPLSARLPDGRWLVAMVVPAEAIKIRFLDLAASHQVGEVATTQWDKSVSRVGVALLPANDGPSLRPIRLRVMDKSGAVLQTTEAIFVEKAPPKPADPLVTGSAPSRP
jgi:hypothetical protein